MNQWYDLEERETASKRPAKLVIPRYGTGMEKTLAPQESGYSNGFSNAYKNGHPAEVKITQLFQDIDNRDAKEIREQMKGVLEVMEADPFKFSRYKFGNVYILELVEVQEMISHGYGLKSLGGRHGQVYEIIGTPQEVLEDATPPDALFLDSFREDPVLDEY